MPAELRPKNPEHQPIFDAAQDVLGAALTLVSLHRQHLDSLPAEDRFLFTDAATAAVTAGDSAAALIATLIKDH